MFCIELTEERIKEPVLASVCFLMSEDALMCACMCTCVRAYMHACVVGEASSPSVQFSAHEWGSSSSLVCSSCHIRLWRERARGKALGAASRPGCPPGRRTWPLPGFSLTPGDTEQWRLHLPAISHPVPWTSRCACLSCSGKTPE